MENVTPLYIYIYIAYGDRCGPLRGLFPLHIFFSISNIMINRNWKNVLTTLEKLCSGPVFRGDHIQRHKKQN